MMFNRLRTIWPKGYQHGSLGKSHQKGDYLKTSNAKNGSSWASALVAFRQGHREGGSEVRQWPRCPWSLGGPSGGPWASRGPCTSGGVWEWHWQISLWNIEDLFWGGLHQNPKKIVAFFSSFLKFTKLEMPNIWVDPEPTFGSRRPYKQLMIYLLLFVANKKLQPHKSINYRCLQPQKIFRSLLCYCIWAYYYLECRLDCKM